VNELGEIETPILLTSTLAVPRVADAVMDYMLALPGNEDVRSVNPLVGETNDGYLNDIRSRSITRDDVLAAIRSARGGTVEEGSVGAGMGTIAFGWKGGIGTASRKLPDSLGGYTVGVLVQANFGGVLAMAGAPVGKELSRYAFREELEGAGRSSKSTPQRTQSGAKGRTENQRREEDDADGSCMIVVATDAPVDARNLKRLAARAIMGMARTGASGSNGSGDYVIAFSTAPELRLRRGDAEKTKQVTVLGNEAMSPLFLAVIEATEEAIYNSLLKATTVTGRGKTVEAIPVERVVEVLKKHGMVTNH
jgi:D-aminopeptidase